jgi:26S proteasome regulatory subunit N2
MEMDDNDDKDDKKDGEDKDGIVSSETAKKKLEKEKVGHDLENMSRVLPAQLKYISFPAGRYAPVKKVSCTMLSASRHTIMLTRI